MLAEDGQPDTESITQGRSSAIALCSERKQIETQSGEGEPCPHVHSLTQ